VSAQPSDDAPRATRDSTPAFWSRRRRRDNEIGQILIRKGSISPEQLRQALRIQSEVGGHVGQILKKLGACESRDVAEALIEQVRVQRSRGKIRSAARLARENPSLGGLEVKNRPALAVAILLLSDIVFLALPASLLVGHVSGFMVSLPEQYVFALLVPLCMLTLSTLRLYSITPPSPPDEIRNTTTAITLVYLGSWMVAVATRPEHFGRVSHGYWLVAWTLSVVLVPIARGTLRSTLCKKRWWGRPVIVLGAGRVGRAVVTTLQSRPQLGLKPVAILDDDPAKLGAVRATWGENDIVVERVPRDADEEFGTPSERSAVEQFAEVDNVPVVGGLELAPALAQRLRIKTVVVAMPQMDSASILALIERFAETYTHVLVIPDVFNLVHFGAPTQYLGGALGIEVRRQLLLRGPRAAKRAMDIVLTSIGGILALPLLLVIALLIRFDSKGPVLHRQRRLGQDGVRFSALKFRTMFLNADELLAQVLDSNPALRVEWDTFKKLPDHPGVTRIGRFLRKYSLDELPQLWNVLRGDMSLVGPRPYMEREIPDMAQKESVILRVRPGLTGIWQVTWRNESTFEQRLQLDVEYVRNWSPWLDIYVIARTFPVVLGGTGS
jgi:lipopolysaccharide/colanic/teichoic acid biosynthesis glycosyltransferase